MFAKEAAAALLSDEGIGVLLDCVGERPGTRTTGRLPPRTLESLLHMLGNCGERGRSTAGAEMVVALHQMVLDLCDCPDPGVSQLAAQVARLFD